MSSNDETLDVLNNKLHELIELNNRENEENQINENDCSIINLDINNYSTHNNF